MSSRESTIELRDLPPLLAAAALPLIVVISQAGILAALPLLALVIPLLFGRYIGESVIERFAARPPVRSRHERRGRVVRPRAITASTLLRTRLLIAASFAERPPPAVLSLS